MGVPVIAVGVPTVIDGAALGSGTEAAPQGLYVTPRDIDRQVRQLGRLLGYGISLALQPGLTTEELAGLGAQANHLPVFQPKTLKDEAVQQELAALAE